MRVPRVLMLMAIPLALGGCDWVKSRIPGTEKKAKSADSIEVAPKGGPGEQIVTVDSSGQGVPTGGTPMAERVAVLGLLNKRNGVARDLTMKPGQAIRAGDVIVRLRACEKTASWEVEQYTGAFAQVDVRETDGKWRRAFSGWLFKERPGLNVVQHPIYDVWVKSCAMSFPGTGEGTVAAGSGDASDERPKARRSSAPKSPETEGAPKVSPAESAPKAIDKSDT